MRATKNPLFLACVFAVVSLPQSAPDFRSKIEIVAIPCAVVDANGSAVAGLTRDEFRVYDNGARRIVHEFWFDTELPLTLGIIIDASESQEGQIAEHRQTALEILERVMRPGDRAFVVSVDEEVRLWADLANTPGEIREQMAKGSGNSFGEPCPKGRDIPGVKQVSVCGASPLWNTIYDAARLKMSTLKGSKALLILTDGMDSGSTRSWHEAANAVQAADTMFYAIQYRSDLGEAMPGISTSCWLRQPGRDSRCRAATMAASFPA